MEKQIAYEDSAEPRYETAHFVTDLDYGLVPMYSVLLVSRHTLLTS